MAIRAIFSNNTIVSKLLITIGVCLVLTTLFSTIGILLCSVWLDIPQDRFAAVSSDLSDPTGVVAAKTLQLMMSLGFFVFPPMVLAFLFDSSPNSYLLTSKAPKSKALGFTVLMFIAALPLVNTLGELNNHLELPASLSGLEQSLREQENRLADLTKAFLHMPALSDLFINLFVIALLPALGEELLFRGILQRLFMEWSGKVHVAVLLTAFVFSAIHMQFYGFVPRFLLGALLGYLVIWSGSLWYSIAAHFVNNATAVVMTYLFEHKYSEIDPDAFGTGSSDLVLFLLSAVAVTYLVILIRKQFITSGEKNPYHTN